MNMPVVIKAGSPQKQGVKPSAPDYSKHLVAKTPVGVTVVEKIVNKQVVAKGEVAESVGPPVSGDCRVRVAGAQKISDGNYGSTLIHVEVEIPATVSGLDHAYDFATDWVSEKLNAAVTALKG